MMYATPSIFCLASFLLLAALLSERDFCQAIIRRPRSAASFQSAGAREASPGGFGFLRQSRIYTGRDAIYDDILLSRISLRFYT